MSEYGYVYLDMELKGWGEGLFGNLFFVVYI